jgi:hypothetical protein
VKLSRLLKTRVLNVLIGCLMAGALLVACGGGDNTNTANTNAGNTKTGNTNAANTAPAANANTTAAAPSADKIGVPECDDYIAKYEACINSKVPENLRATYKGAFDSARKAWRDAAATPQGKAGLATACKAAHDQAKTTLGSFGCSW